MIWPASSAEGLNHVNYLLYVPALLRKVEPRHLGGRSRLPARLVRAVFLRRCREAQSGQRAAGLKPESKNHSLTCMVSPSLRNKSSPERTPISGSRPPVKPRRVRHIYIYAAQGHDSYRHRVQRASLFPTMRAISLLVAIAVQPRSLSGRDHFHSDNRGGE